jgi:hypothetical protein
MAQLQKNILHEELGWHKTRWPLRIYNLQDDTRDRLLAHARQDAAHALCNTVTLLDQVKILRRATFTLTRYLFWEVPLR